MVNMIIQLEKAQRSAGLVRETRHVTRNGQSFNMAVWVRPGANRARPASPAGDDSRQGKLGIALPQGALLAPNGKPSNLSPAQWHQCRTRAFKDWFGDWEHDPKNASQAVDENGEPKVVHHGTANFGFNEFDHSFERSARGFFFSTNYDVANSYVPNDEDIEALNYYGNEGHEGGLYSCFVNIRNPYKVDFESMPYNDGPDGLTTDEAVGIAHDNGNDGAFLFDVDDSGGFRGDNKPATVVVVFRVNDIKSATDNMGTFDPHSSEISKSLTFSGWKLQGRMKFQGMQVSIENKKGTYRSGVSKDGHKWRNFMHYAYGYIRGTVGPDGDHVDCYIGPDKKSTRVFVVHQNDPKTGKYDEDKVMLGFSSPEEAKKAYLGQYDSPKFFGSMEETDIGTFKTKVFMKKNHGKKLVIRS